MYNLGLEQDATSVSSRGTLAHSVSCRRHPFGTIAFTYHHQRSKREGARVRLSAAPCKDVLHQVMARPLAQFVLGRQSVKELLRGALKPTVCRKSRSVRTATSSLGGSLFKPYFFLARSVENGRQGWLSSSFPAMCAGCKPTRRPGVASGGPLFIRRVTAEELDPIREAE